MLVYEIIIFVIFFFSFLGYVDKIGTAFDAPTLATGYGAYIAQVFGIFVIMAVNLRNILMLLIPGQVPPHSSLVLLWGSLVPLRDMEILQI